MHIKNELVHVDVDVDDELLDDASKHPSFLRFLVCGRRYQMNKRFTNVSFNHFPAENWGVLTTGGWNIRIVYHLHNHFVPHVRTSER